METAAPAALADVPPEPVQLQASADPANRAVHLAFGRATDSISMSPEDARQLSRALIRLARAAAGVVEGGNARR